ncbi:ABC transporter ATP-binding protein [Poseidonocella sp. HB161398]|uniref:ABC transporter ATP-binding protein n=1 Tax=Poseidonocella sp. HB161398 TaxID=2320855 RepID=UPI001109828F|nr:ABC transporter ATP-binding protein [Poseidonocella sp. HB161398]
MTPIPITLDALRKTYGDYVALDDVSLAIRPGEFLTLLGPSGSGKTTLLMALAGFVRPEAGRILIGGRDVTRLAPNRRDIGIVFQNYALFPHMDVLANVEYPLRLRKVSRRQARERAMAALARVKLDAFAGRDISQLSGGQRQRVALARAIVFEPRIMLMDEPLSALDKNLREHMQLEIRRLHDDLGITTIYVTHDQREALTMSDRIAVMKDGCIRQIDAPQDIYSRPGSGFVAEFMGEANILAGGDCATLDGTALSSAATLMIRAENLHLDARTCGTDGLRLEGRLAGKAYRGENWLLQVALASGKEVMLSIPAAAAAGCETLAPGDPVAAFAARRHAHPIPAPEAA